MPIRESPSIARRMLGLAALVMGCWTVSIPAQAGLGDLVDGALDEVVELPVITTLPIPLSTVSLLEVTIPPVVVDLPTVSTPEVALPIVEGLLPAVQLPSIVISPPTVEIGQDGGIDVDPDGPPVVMGGAEPRLVVESPPVDTPDAERIASDLAPRPDLPTRFELPVVAAKSSSLSASDRPAQDRSIEIRLLRAISTNSVTAEIETDALPPLADIPLSWLASLEAWLGVESLTDVIAIPVRLLALLFRALLSAGSGLIAPASILTAIAFGARRKPVPTVG